MIVVKVELWPRGFEKNSKELCRAYISNDVKTTVSTKGKYGSYNAELAV